MNNTKYLPATVLDMSLGKDKVKMKKTFLNQRKQSILTRKNIQIDELN